MPASARAGNVVGGGDWSGDRLIPDCVRALGAGQLVSLRNPGATRPWQHVLEPLCGYLLLAERLWHDPPAAAAWTGDDRTHPHEAGRLAVDATRARHELGWRPRLNLEQTIVWTSRWYKDHLAGAPARTLVGRDIDAYEAGV